MAEFKYPLRKRWVHSGEIVEFTELRTGTVIDPGSSYKRVGYHSTTFTPHTHSFWTPVEQPIKHRLHEAVMNYKEL